VVVRLSCRALRWFSPASSLRPRRFSASELRARSARGPRNGEDQTRAARGRTDGRRWEEHGGERHEQSALMLRRH
jgi:hypothetical protein